MSKAEPAAKGCRARGVAGPEEAPPSGVEAAGAWLWRGEVPSSGSVLSEGWEKSTSEERREGPRMRPGEGGGAKAARGDAPKATSKGSAWLQVGETGRAPGKQLLIKSGGEGPLQASMPWTRVIAGGSPSSLSPSRPAPNEPRLRGLDMAEVLG